ncbi:DUF397 domain-containing protein [Streptomyces sp. SID3212]|uniref:DUF397 domain-containing protein n=1 Tax=Streptomyces sp. SID3212 TaxID=2690259 RepID=UPI001368C2ED|nr:DUF397 domain-containing protein [Streptomyces sp. SID3212]MYV55433.1 DUF397 domain-containing protein [Streptomyces sp. SID3212]
MTTSTLRWFKSSYSSDSGGECIEVAFDWRKSSYSSDAGGQCIEVATTPHSIHLRDSKTHNGPSFAVAPTSWTTFLNWTA